MCPVQSEYLGERPALPGTAESSAPSAIIRSVPFTLAHAAAAYPLRRTRLVLSALIFGTFAPDLEFFLRFAPKGPFGHSARGLFVFCLPVAFGIFWIFHDLVKEPLAALMPRAIRERIVPGVYPMSLRRPLQLAFVLVSILIGSLTHILWDSFTHASYWPGHHLPFLRDEFLLPVIGEVHLYKLLQYASTIFGLLVLYFWLRHWARTAPVQEYPAGSSVPRDHARIARILIPAIALAGGLLRAYLALRYPITPRAIEFCVANFVVASISFAWVELMVWGFALPVRYAHDLPLVSSAR